MKVYDTAAIKQVADLETVAEAIGMETRRNGNRTWFICPNPYHNDKNFGSCYSSVDKSTGDPFWTCKACGEHGDVIKMVQLFKGVHFDEACRIIGEIFGDKNEFVISDKKVVAEQKNLSVQKRLLPNAETLEILGIQNFPVYSVVGIYDDWENIEPDPSLMTDWVPGKNEEEGFILQKEKVTGNPLLDLKIHDPEAYEFLINSRCKESTMKIKSLKNDLRKTDNERFKMEMLSACDRLLSQIDDVSIENGGCENLSLNKPVFKGLKLKL